MLGHEEELHQSGDFLPSSVFCVTIYWDNCTNRARYPAQEFSNIYPFSFRLISLCAIEVQSISFKAQRGVWPLGLIVFFSPVPRHQTSGEIKRLAGYKRIHCCSDLAVVTSSTVPLSVTPFQHSSAE